MKKILLCMLIGSMLMLPLYGCKTYKYEKVKFQTDNEMTREELNNKDGTGLTMDEDLAFEIGKAVLEKHYYEEKPDTSHYVVYDVPNENMFVVRVEPNNIKTMGGEYGVAIDRKDGKILKIWLGE